MTRRCHGRERDRGELPPLRCPCERTPIRTDIVLHSLRHSAAAAMLLGGVPLPVVSQVLGHGSSGVTATVYSYVTPHASAEAISAFGSMF